MKHIAGWLAVMMVAAGMCVAGAADTPDEGVVSSYEFSSVSYGNSQDGNTYHHVITKRNGVVDTDVTTVNNGAIVWDKDAQGQYVDGQMKVGGVQFKGNGNITGVQTDAADKTSAVSVAYLEEQIAQLKKEIEELKHKNI